MYRPFGPQERFTFCVPLTKTLTKAHRYLLPVSYRAPWPGTTLSYRRRLITRQKSRCCYIWRPVIIRLKYCTPFIFGYPTNLLAMTQWFQPLRFNRPDNRPVISVVVVNKKRRSANTSRGRQLLHILILDARIVIRYVWILRLIEALVASAKPSC